jgi:hypothetical protein
MKPQIGIDQGVYSVWWDDPPVHMDFDRLRWDRYGQLGAEVTVWVVEPFEERVHSAWATITTTDGRGKLAKHCATRAPSVRNWLELVDAACVCVRDAHRIGEPAILIADAPDVVLGEAQLRDVRTGDPLLHRNELTILYGDGDTGKSMVALLFGAIIHTGRDDLAGLETPRENRSRVAYADWETSAATQKARLRRMFGEFYPQDLVYIRGAGLSLPDSVDRFRRIVREHRIGYLIVDSIAYACGGPPEDAVVASGFLNALQQLGLGSRLGVLAIAHVTKADTKAATDKPFGSAFWHNSARLTWYARRTYGGREQYNLGLFCKKNNLGPRPASVGLSLDFADQRLTFGRSEVADDPELASVETLSVRIHRLLARQRGACMTYAAIAAELAEDDKVVAETCRRGIKSGFLSWGPEEGRCRTVELAARDIVA